MRRAVRFLRLPAAERRLALEAAATLTLVCALLKALPFARMMRLLGLHEPGGPAAGAVDASTARAVARAVARASRNLPFPAVCLPQAAAAAVMLRRRGLAAEVHFGVAKRAGTVEAHAWSRCGDVLVSGGTDSPAFSPIAVFRA
ncbi:MAG TPA: lasso peptide biosynthesis B2 protein [Azospirillum sp.]|nr:lasso peptide biosynthesis B2 protein [Azospirillum sp.]